MKKLLFLFCLVCSIAQAQELTSPCGDYRFVFSRGAQGEILYTIYYKGHAIVEQSELGVDMDNRLQESAMGIKRDADSHWCNGLQLIGEGRTAADTTWQPLYGERAVVRDRYNQLTLRFTKGEKGEETNGYAKHREYGFHLIVRAYDEGIAFRYHFPEASNGLFLNITQERTTFAMPAGTKGFYEEWAQGPYEWRELKDWPLECERPLLMQTPDGTWVALLEAEMTDYARGKFRLLKDNTLQVALSGEVQAMPPYSTPWRVVMAGEKAVDLINHKDLILNLNPPCQIADTRFIRPGKAFRCGLSKADIMRGIHFARQMNLQYIELDARWYGLEMTWSSSALTEDPKMDFTIREVCDSARTAGLGVFLYVNQRALYQQLDSILPLYKEWGVSGLKFGFVQVGNQMWSHWLHEAVKKCAQYGLMVDIHDEYRPTGFSRTYPNLMTQEGIRGNEEMPDAWHNTVLPFTRFLCGPADYTLCYYNNRVKNTRAHQLAMAAVYYSPLQFMFWYDDPQLRDGGEELRFWHDIPTVFAESIALCGEPGEYIVQARRSGDRWFVGAMNGLEARRVEIPTDFLPAGRYTVTFYYDNPQLTTASKVATRTFTHKAGNSIALDLCPSGGAAMIIKTGLDNDIDFCVQQVRRGLDSMRVEDGGAIDYHRIPRNILQGETRWNRREAVAAEWCSGFYPGILWMAYEASGDTAIKAEAEKFSAELEHLARRPAHDHDLGFLAFNSLGHQYRLTGDERVKRLLLDIADTLATLYNPKVGTICSWPNPPAECEGMHNTIIDNIINLELLFWAARNGGLPRLREIAETHARTTMCNQFNCKAVTSTNVRERSVNEGWRVEHVALYDSITGEFVKRVTHQGHHDGSLWARGLAWAVWGYTMCFRETGDSTFLNVACQAADVFLRDLPADGIPYWDYDDPAIPNAPRDASAAAVVASGLIELSQYVEPEKGANYLSEAKRILKSLGSESYRPQDGSVACTLHSTGNLPAGYEVDCSIVYADYYYLEALLRLKALNQK